MKFLIPLFFSILLFLNPNTYTKKSISIFFAWPAEYLEHFVLGYKLPVADMFWIRFIQDIDHKDTEQGKTHLGWAYEMLDGITSLDHYYRIAYITGGTVLSVNVEDQLGATKILEKGIKNFPKDWPLHYRLGYHYLYEVKDCAKAAENFNKAAALGAPIWLTSLASRLYTASAQYEIAERVLNENLERFKDTAMEPVLLQRKKELEQEKQGLSATGKIGDKPARLLCQPPKN